MKIKGGGPRKSAKPAEEPVFYKMPFLPPHASQKSEQQAVYQMYQPHANTAVRSQGVNTVLEQALAQQAYFQFASQHRNAPAFAPLPCPPPFPSAAVASHPVSLSHALGYHSLQDTSPQDASNPHLFAAMREKEMITAALLDRLRRH